jgi:RecB family exonuclease
MTTEPDWLNPCEPTDPLLIQNLQQHAAKQAEAFIRDDPRRGLPSASSLHRLVNCPGSYRAEREAIARGMTPPDDSEEAASGTRIHRYLETESDGDWQALSYDEQRTATLCQGQAKWLIVDFLKRNGNLEWETRERRFAITPFGVTGDFSSCAAAIGSGQADRIIGCGNHILILDYKTGRGDVTPADANDQLRGLAPLVSHFRPESVEVAIVAPLTGQPTTAVFDREALKAAKAWLVRTWLSAPHATQTKAGAWCQYCPARLVCGTYAAYNAATLAPLTQGGLPPDKVKEALFARAYEADTATLAEMGERVRMLEWGAAAIKAAIRRRLEEGGLAADELRDAGWELLETNGNREIADPDKAAVLLAPLLAGAEGGPQAALMRAAKLSAATLTEEIHKASGKKSATRYNMTAKQAKDALAQALGELMTQRTKTELTHTPKLP